MAPISFPGTRVNRSPVAGSVNGRATLGLGRHFHFVRFEDAAISYIDNALVVTHEHGLAGHVKNILSSISRNQKVHGESRTKARV